LIALDVRYARIADQIPHRSETTLSAHKLTIRSEKGRQLHLLLIRFHFPQAPAVRFIGILDRDQRQ
jgi:hypothetical protein